MPPKGKPDTAAYQKLKQDLKGGTLGNLYMPSTAFPCLF